ncbi:MAG TPA: hypothetical protein VKM55_10195 [Candidatus Lokiarchaeia archaeon]|nr:hypothetical protein [Candidatus Lokiarchaeia archaeon]
MKIIVGKHSETYDFEDSDKRHDHFNQLIDLKNQGLMTEDDFDIIASLYPFHENLPSLEAVIVNQGFILKVDEIGLYLTKQLWNCKKEGEAERFLEFDSFSSILSFGLEEYSCTTTYDAGDVIAKKGSSHTGGIYGEKEKFNQYFIIKIKGKVVLEENEERDGKVMRIP